MTDPDDQAFPRPTHVDDSAGRDGHHAITTEGGLTKREYFAAVILAGFGANPDISEAASKQGLTPAQARVSYAVSAVRQADELIEALNRKPGS